MSFGGYSARCPSIFKENATDKSVEHRPSSGGEKRSANRLRTRCERYITDMVINVKLTHQTTQYPPVAPHSMRGPASLQRSGFARQRGPMSSTERRQGWGLNAEQCSWQTLERVYRDSLMPSHTPLLIKLFSQTNKFQIRRVDGFVFLYRNLENLTAICAPRLRKRNGEAALDYGLGLTALTSEGDREKALTENLQLGRYVILPRVIPLGHSFDRLIRN